LVLVELTQGHWAVIDAADADEVSRYNWFAAKPKGSKTFYAGTGHDLLGTGKRRTWLHRFIASLHGIDLSGLIDHKNVNGLDCRQSNIRPATKATNARNRGIDRNNTSGVKGVHFEASTQKWRAEIWVDKRHIRLGRFDTLEEAAAVIAVARREHHGEFARQELDS
jgi:hypothetical protein